MIYGILKNKNHLFKQKINKLNLYALKANLQFMKMLKINSFINFINYSFISNRSLIINKEFRIKSASYFVFFFYMLSKNYELINLKLNLIKEKGINLIM